MNDFVSSNSRPLGDRPPLANAVPGKLLFQSLQLREVSLPNRIVVAPMQQYMATAEGLPTEWHYDHYRKLATSGAGLVISGALAIESRGRTTYGDLGVWADHQIGPLAQIAACIERYGSVAGAQIVHAGRKASVRRPWEGFGPIATTPGPCEEVPWSAIGPSPIAMDEGWPVPREMTRDDISAALDAYAAAARRLHKAGFKVLNIHGAHGFLIHTFLSPHSNRRDDEYGGSFERRIRFALEVADAVRSEWPAANPLFYRLSCVDDVEGGWSLDDTVALSAQLALHGVDVVDCSSGSLQKRTTTTIVPRKPGYQVHFAEAVRRETSARTMAVGLIRTGPQAEEILVKGQADLVAIGREMLVNPHWPMQAAVDLGGADGFDAWPAAYGWWLKIRQRIIDVSN